MLETTHFAGEPPNRELVYELRQLALHSTDLIQMLDLIAARIVIPAGEVWPVVLIGYLNMAFNVGIPESKSLVAILEHGTDGYILNDPDHGYANAVMAQIEANRDGWTQNLVAP